MVFDWCGALIGETVGMGTEANATYIEAVEAAEIIGELLTYPHPDWVRIGALAERIQRIADEQPR